jgi:DNA-binding transcriptional MerR regulator
MKELSEASGVPVPTIKFYLRERLLPAGDRTGPNQADYSQAHVRRIRLIRALIEVGGLSVATARAVTGVLDLPGQSLHNVLGLAQHAMAGGGDTPDSEEFRAARSRIDELVDRLGWQVHQANPGRDGAAAVLTTLAALNQEGLSGILEPYARAAEIAARADLTAVARAGTTGDRDAMVCTAVIAMVVGETLTLHLRRMAQEHVSSQQMSTPQQGES